MIVRNSSRTFCVTSCIQFDESYHKLFCDMRYVQSESVRRSVIEEQHGDHNQDGGTQAISEIGENELNDCRSEKEEEEKEEEKEKN